MKQTWSINQSIIIIKQEGVKNHTVPESSRSLQQKFHIIPFYLLKAVNNSLTKNLYYAQLSIFSCENTQVCLKIHCVLFHLVQIYIMIGFSLFVCFKG